jgi:hypothetical protein
MMLVELKQQQPAAERHSQSQLLVLQCGTIKNVPVNVSNNLIPT